MSSLEAYDILLSTTQIPGYVSLEYFILANIVGLKQDKTRTIESLVREFRKIKESRLEGFETMAKDNRSTGDYKYLSDANARNIEYQKFMKENIIDVYVDTNKELSDIDVSKMTSGEVSELSERLFMAYISRKFSNTKFDENLKEIEYEQPTDFVDIDGIELTIGEYIDYMVEQDNDQIKRKMVEACVNHRKVCVKIIPGFAQLIASAPLDNIKPVVEEADVIEDLNFEILKQIQPVISKDLEEAKPPEDFVKTVIRVLQELVIEVSEFDVGKGKLVIDNAACRLILAEMFPSCYRIGVPAEPLPEYVKEFFVKLEEFEDINPAVFWYYFKAYNMLNRESSTRTVITGGWRDTPEAKKLIEKVARSILVKYESMNRYTPDQRLRMALYRGPVTVYTQAGCPFCTKAKALLRRSEIKFEEKQPPLPEKFRSTQKTVPFILVGEDTVVGGSDDLERIMNAPQVRPRVMR